MTVDRLLEMANARAIHSIDWARKEIAGPPLGDSLSWTSAIPTDLLAVWGQLSLEAQIVAYWVAEHNRKVPED